MNLATLFPALGIAVLAFLWQGTLLGLLTALALRLMRRRTPTERHLLGFVALLAALAIFAAGVLGAWLDPAPVHLTGADASPVGGSPASASSGPFAPLPATVAAWSWVCGVVFLSLRFLVQSRAVRHLKTSGVEPPEASWQRLFGRMRSDFGVHRGVRLLKSHLADVPMVVGWFSPVVLVPAAAFTGLGMDELRALLAHELAHVRRRDPWFNAAQTLVETLLFFHPAIWWISKQVRLEREYCCDDSSVQWTGNPGLLAQALAAMEELRPDSPMTQTVLGANGGPLMQRIARILGVPPTPRSTHPGWQVVATLALMGLVALGGTTFARTQEPAPAVKEKRAKQEHKQAARQLDTELARQRAELRAALEAGKITEEEAVRRSRAIEERAQAGQRDRAAEDLREEALLVQEKLEAAVASGRITREQADARMAEWKAGIAERSRRAEELERLRADLKAAVQAGRLTAEEAKERLAEYERHFSDKPTDRADPEAVIARIRAAVQNGDLTPAEGMAKIAALREKWAAERAAKERHEAAVQEIRAAVEAGTLTAEEGRARLEELRRARKDQGLEKTRKPDMKALRAELEAAVKAGKITKEEARGRLAEFERQLRTDRKVEGEQRERRERRKEK